MSGTLIDKCPVLYKVSFHTWMPFLFFLLVPNLFFSQSTFVNEGRSDQIFIDRHYLLHDIEFDHSSIRNQSAQYLISNQADSLNLSELDGYSWNLLKNRYPEIAYIRGEQTKGSSSRTGWFRNFYRSKYSMIRVQNKDFFLNVNPIVQFDVGEDFEDDQLIFQNTRGITINGLIDRKVYFKTQILENQQRFFNYFEREIERVNAIPGQGFFRPYQSGVIDAVNGWDFLNASGYGGLRISKSIDLRLGHGRHFIGNGIRSLLLSDYANNYFYLQLNTRIWKFHLQNTFAELSAFSSRDNQGDELLPKKYMANHYLDFQVSSKFSIGLFESVIFSRENNFEFQYLNPIILYRSVEQFLDSPDNVLLGINLAWNFKKGWQAYGQFILDELRTDQIFSGDGWWGNKVGYQLGLKWFDAFNVAQLNFQVEHNTARPYTYAHRHNDPTQRPVTSYTHFNQALAHPLGANFRETILLMNYRFSRKVVLNGQIVLSNYGEEETGNIGRNILLNYESRDNDFGNFTGQGNSNSTFMFQLHGSYEFFPNFYLDVQYLHRNQNDDFDLNLSTNYLGFGIRANIGKNYFIL